MKKLIPILLSAVMMLTCLTFTASADVAADELAPYIKNKLESGETDIDISDFTGRYGWGVDETVNEIIASAFF